MLDPTITETGGISFGECKCKDISCAKLQWEEEKCEEVRCKIEPTADEMFEELGYEKEESEYYIEYKKRVLLMNIR